MKEFLLHKNGGIYTWEFLLYMFILFSPLLYVFSWLILKSLYERFAFPSYQIIIKGEGKFHPMKKELWYWNDFGSFDNYKEAKERIEKDFREYQIKRIKDTVLEQI